VGWRRWVSGLLAEVSEAASAFRFGTPNAQRPALYSFEVPKTRAFAHRRGRRHSGCALRYASAIPARTTFLYFHCTLMLTVAVLLAMFGSGVSDIVAAFAVITVPGEAVTFTVNRTVHVVLGAILLFSLQ